MKNIVAKKVLEGTLTQEEESDLEAWLESDPDNILMLERLKTLEMSNLIIKVENEGLGSEMAELFINATKGFKTKKRRAIISRIAYSASAAAIIAISWLLVDFNKNILNKEILSNNETVVIQEEIVHRESMIQLITAEKILNLDKDANFIAESQIDVKRRVNPDRMIGIDEKPQINTLIVPLSKECNFILPDGSRVWINSDSKLMFPTKFSDTLRSVELIGEAYFEIKKNTKAPFIVKTKDISTTVLGTQFMVSCYENKNEVSLIEGSVVVSKSGSNSKIILKPGRGVILNEESNLQEVAINKEKVLGRKNGLIMYDEEKLSDIGDDLKHLYGVEFIFENEALKNQTFYIKINRHDSIEYIMQLLRYTKKINYIINEDKIIIKPYSL